MINHHTTSIHEMKTSVIEDLGFDKNGNASSNKLIKYGPNRGKRHIEKNGMWVYVTGHTYYDDQKLRSQNYEWAKKLANLGIKVGSTHRDDCVSFYINLNYLQ